MLTDLTPHFRLRRVKSTFHRNPLMTAAADDSSMCFCLEVERLGISRLIF